MTFSFGQTDADIKRLVDAAHKVGVEVILSIGGGGGDQQILQFYNAGLSRPLVKSLNVYVHDRNLDGVDLDIEDPNNMGEPYAEFTQVLVDIFRSQHKIVTAAVAEYLQDAMPDKALHMFDFVNVMNYSNYSDAVTAMEYYANEKKVPNERITLGVLFLCAKRRRQYRRDIQHRVGGLPRRLANTIWSPAEASMAALPSTTWARTPWTAKRNWGKNMAA
jgi:chitinase